MASTETTPFDVYAVGGNERLLITFAPFLAAPGLLVLGGVVGHTGIGILDFLLLPKGALIAAALLALWQTPPQSGVTVWTAPFDGRDRCFWLPARY